MSLSSHYAESFEGNTYDPGYPTMSDDIKESLDKFDIPVFIENMTRRESGQYGVYQDYHVRLDTDSVEYKQADRKKHFASSRYTCGLPEDKGRKAAYENEIKPNYEGQEIPVLLKGYPSKSHPGKTYYKFEDVPDEEGLI